MNRVVPTDVSFVSVSERDIAATNKIARKAVRAAMIGNFVEWFDYGIFGYMAPVIATIFFPSEDRTAALMMTYAVLAMTLFFRPLGGIYFGRMADKLGRKKVLATTILIMAAATGAVGLLPTHAQLGTLAPVLLILCRLVQGFAAGGEYAGAVTFVVEYGPPKKRAFYASFVGVSVFLGLFAGSGLVGYLSHALPSESLTSWGWRIPFLLSIPVGAIGFYIRMKLEDTPEFKKVLQTGNVESAPLRDALSTQWRNMGIFFSFAICNAVASYLFSSYLTTYLIEVANHTKPDALFSNSIALVVLCCILPAGGLLADRYGRKPMILTASIFAAIIAVPAFIIAGMSGFGVVVIAQLLFMMIFFFITPSVTVSMAEMFPASVRVTAGAISYNLAFTLFGGTTPFISTALVEFTGNKLAPAYYLVGVALFTTVAVALFYREPSRSE